MAGVFGDASTASEAESDSESGAEEARSYLASFEAESMQAEMPAAQAPEQARSDEESEYDVVDEDPRELFPSDSEMEVFELLRDLHPDTYEEKYRAYKAQVEEYESCGYW